MKTMLPRFVSPEFLMGPFVPMGGVTVVVGPAQSGKTAVLAGLVQGMAMGKNVFVVNEETPRRKVTVVGGGSALCTRLAGSAEVGARPYVRVAADLAGVEGAWADRCSRAEGGAGAEGGAAAEGGASAAGESLATSAGAAGSAGSAGFASQGSSESEPELAIDEAAVGKGVVLVEDDVCAEFDALTDLKRRCRLTEAVTERVKRLRESVARRGEGAAAEGDVLAHVMAVNGPPINTRAFEQFLGALRGAAAVIALVPDALEPRRGAMVAVRMPGVEMPSRRGFTVVAGLGVIDQMENLEEDQPVLGLRSGVHPGRRAMWQRHAQWLAARLEQGPVQVSIVEGEALAEGLSLRALRTAKVGLGVRSIRMGTFDDGQTVWQLPPVVPAGMPKLVAGVVAAPGEERRGGGVDGNGGGGSAARGAGMGSFYRAVEPWAGRGGR